MTERKCGSCDHWDPSAFKNDKDGLCRRFPPITEKFLFPIVSNDVHCGEWKEKVVVPMRKK